VFNAPLKWHNVEETMNTNKLLAVVIGLALLSFGILTLAANLLAAIFDFNLTWLEPWRYWPVIVLGIGTLLFLLATLSIRRRGWGALFIPAIPINVTGALLLFASIFNQWHIWRFGWSFIILGLAVGFLFAAVATRVVWFLIPAVLIGVNGLALAFCSLTGLWHWWSVLWVIEPLAVGLVLLLVAYKSRTVVPAVIGAVLCGFSALALFMGAGMLLLNNWGFRLAIPLFLLMAGGLLLAAGTVRRPLMLEQ
jgi:hypothetical protein